MREVMDLLKALGDENRVRVLLALRGRELCVCQIIELLSLAPSTVSKHMAILRQARLVESRKAGRWIHYRLPREDEEPEACRAMAWLGALAGGEERVGEDMERLAQIVAQQPEALCRNRQAS